MGIIAAEPEAQFTNFLIRMLAKEPKDRPTMDEVVITLQDARIQSYFLAYGEKKEKQKKRALTKYRSNTMEAQQDTMDALNRIMYDYKESLLDMIKGGKPDQDTQEYQKLVGDTASDILRALEANQERHEKIWYFRASTFNLMVIKYLPEELRKAVYKKILGENFETEEGEKGEKARKAVVAFEQKHDHDTRQLLAGYISEYQKLSQASASAPKVK